MPRPRNEKKYEAYVNHIVGYLSAIEYLLIKIITNPRRTQQQSDNLSLKFVEKKEHWTKAIVRKCTFTAHFSNSHAIEQVCPPLGTCLAHDVGMPALCSIDICSIDISVEGKNHGAPERTGLREQVASSRMGIFLSESN